MSTGNYTAVYGTNPWPKTAELDSNDTKYPFQQNPLINHVVFSWRAYDSIFTYTQKGIDRQLLALSVCIRRKTFCCTSYEGWSGSCRPIHQLPLCPFFCRALTW